MTFAYTVHAKISKLVNLVCQFVQFGFNVASMVEQHGRNPWLRVCVSSSGLPPPRPHNQVDWFSVEVAMHPSVFRRRQIDNSHHGSVWSQCFNLCLLYLARFLGALLPSACMSHRLFEFPAVVRDWDPIRSPPTGTVPTRPQPAVSHGIFFTAALWGRFIVSFRNSLSWRSKSSLHPRAASEPRSVLFSSSEAL